MEKNRNGEFERMRLIDADKFKHGIISQSNTGKESYPTELICEFIDNQPTVYDMDKVVEQIKEKGKRICCSVKCTENCGDCEHGYLMKGILEIVKADNLN